jgi:hypothetical protein
MCPSYFIEEGPEGRRRERNYQNGEVAKISFALAGRYFVESHGFFSSAGAAPRSEAMKTTGRVSRPQLTSAMADFIANSFSASDQKFSRLLTRFLSKYKRSPILW